MDQYTDTVLTCEAIVRKKNGAQSLKRVLSRDSRKQYKSIVSNNANGQKEH